MESKEIYEFKYLNGRKEYTYSYTDDGKYWLLDNGTRAHKHDVYKIERKIEYSVNDIVSQLERDPSVLSNLF